MSQTRMLESEDPEARYFGHPPACSRKSVRGARRGELGLGFSFRFRV